MLTTAYVLLALYGSEGLMYQDSHTYATQSSCETALQNLENVTAFNVGLADCFAVGDEKPDKAVLFILVAGDQLVRVGTYPKDGDCKEIGKAISTFFSGIPYGCTPNIK